VISWFLKVRFHKWVNLCRSSLVRLAIDLRPLLEMRAFCNHKLQLSDRGGALHVGIKLTHNP
jgi:hypothetical protein